MFIMISVIQRKCAQPSFCGFCEGIDKSTLRRYNHEVNIVIIG